MDDGLVALVIDVLVRKRDPRAQEVPSVAGLGWMGSR